MDPWVKAHGGKAQKANAQSQPLIVPRNIILG